MSMPGFTGHSALYRSRGQYRLGFRRDSKMMEVIPALTIRDCDNIAILCRQICDALYPDTVVGNLTLINGAGRKCKQGCREDQVFNCYPNTTDDVVVLPEELLD